ncbi:hypothetical protein THAOC_23741, partial [Thalassiosira oceanica]
SRRSSPAARPGAPEAADRPGEDSEAEEGPEGEAADRPGEDSEAEEGPEGEAADRPGEGSEAEEGPEVEAVGPAPSPPRRNPVEARREVR